jgi:hypothetical protein
LALAAIVAGAFLFIKKLIISTWGYLALAKQKISHKWRQSFCRFRVSENKQDTISRFGVDKFGARCFL